MSYHIRRVTLWEAGRELTGHGVLQRDLGQKLEQRPRSYQVGGDHLETVKIISSFHLAWKLTMPWISVVRLGHDALFSCVEIDELFLNCYSFDKLSKCLHALT